MATTINIAKHFSAFPGPRYIKLGPHSGELFREEYLLPAIREHGGEVTVVLDGAMGYGSSFLEESFGGLLRRGVDPAIVTALVDRLVSETDPSLIDEIKGYVSDEMAR